ncbi:MAG TPA: ABC transporter permease [Microbacteriaceae bacterium]|nr:ABC transporter permease [Microbacteriaceae bacterium]
MTWLETLHTAWTAVHTHTMRSILTALGVLIGIAAVILTVGLGLGTQQNVTAQIDALGSNLLIVSPGSSTSTSGVRGGFGTGSTLTLADAEALQSKVNAPDVKAVAPQKSTELSLTAGQENWTTSVVGVTPSWLAVRGRSLSEGSFITAKQNADQADVVVLGTQTAEELFGTTRVVGQQVTISGQSLEVVGVLASAGSNSSSNLDDMAVVPISTAASQIIGGTNQDSVSSVYVEATSQSTLSAADQETTNLLLNLHGIATSTDADFTVSSQDSLVSTATAVYRTLTVLLTGIAALSLIVGGIGVMNIMLVSVTERTKEIGLRKALGAPPSAIRWQFLVEAAILGLSGGILGAALGIGSALALPGVIGSPIVVSAPAVAGSIAVAVAVGLVFGVYPVARAARLAPIDALRSE